MKHAIVTGASRGLGRAISLALAREGYHLHLSARNETDLQNLAKEIKTVSDVRVAVDSIDFYVRESVRAYGNRLAKELPSVDVLVNNIGSYIPDKLDAKTHLDQNMAVNFYGTFELCQSLLERLITQKGGYVFNVLSVASRKPRVEAAGYTIAKHSLHAYHLLLQETLKPHGVKVTGFFPGSINTSSWEGTDAPRQDFVQPEDIAALIVTTMNMKRGTVVSDIDLSSINPDF